jgi:hypothetical protein
MRLIEELKARGMSVVLRGYWLLPDNAWQYRELGRRIADRLVIVAQGRDTVDPFGSTVLAPVLAEADSDRFEHLAEVRLVTYGQADEREEDAEIGPSLMGCPRFDVGTDGRRAHADSWSCEEPLARFLAEGLPTNS